MSNNDNAFNEHGYKISRLEGLVLTQLEASMPQGSQLEALKSVVRSLIWDWFHKNFGGPDIGQAQQILGDYNRRQTDPRAIAMPTDTGSNLPQNIEEDK